MVPWAHSFRMRTLREVTLCAVNVIFMAASTEVEEEAGGGAGGGAEGGAEGGQGSETQKVCAVRGTRPRSEMFSDSTPLKEIQYLT